MWKMNENSLPLSSYISSLHFLLFASAFSLEPEDSNPSRSLHSCFSLLFFSPPPPHSDNHPRCFFFSLPLVLFFSRRFFFTTHARTISSRPGTREYIPADGVVATGNPGLRASKYCPSRKSSGTRRAASGLVPSSLARIARGGWQRGSAARGLCRERRGSIVAGGGHRGLVKKPEERGSRTQSHELSVSLFFFLSYSASGRKIQSAR